MENWPFIHWIFSGLIMVALAWGGARYAIGDHDKKLTSHQLMIEGLKTDIMILTPLVMTVKIQDEIKHLVPFSVCRDKQHGCREDNEGSTAEILKKIDKLSELLALQDEKREAGKDKIQDAVTLMGRQVTDLAATLRERGKIFQKLAGGEPNEWA